MYFFVSRRHSVAVFVLLANIFQNFFFNLIFIHWITKTLTHVHSISKYMCWHVSKPTSKLFLDIFKTISLYLILKYKTLFSDHLVVLTVYHLYYYLYYIIIIFFDSLSLSFFLPKLKPANRATLSPVWTKTKDKKTGD